MTQRPIRRGMSEDPVVRGRGGYFASVAVAVATFVLLDGASRMLAPPAPVPTETAFPSDWITVAITLGMALFLVGLFALPAFLLCLTISGRDRASGVPRDLRVRHRPGTLAAVHRHCRPTACEHPVRRGGRRRVSVARRPTRYWPSVARGQCRGWLECEPRLERRRYLTEAGAGHGVASRAATSFRRRNGSANGGS